MNPLIIIAGPTAVGKSDMAVKLANRINGEIISADSMQVYRGMDIGSAKITKEEMGGIRHHLIDILDPSEEFNVVLFKEFAKKAIEDIRSRDKIPIVVGGTGFYIQALLYDIDFSESEGFDEEYRKELEKIKKEKGIEALFEMLRSVDPKTCEVIHMNNTKRVYRALEYFHETGKTMSEHNAKQHEKEAFYDFKYFVLTDDREVLYSRIDKRVDLMIEKGLLNEVKVLKDKGYVKTQVSMQGLGYKEILSYLDGELSLDEAVYIIKRDSRHFAKRQLTWFKRERDVIWINKSDYERNDGRILDYLITECQSLLD